MAKKRKNFIREKRIYCGEEYLEVDIVAVTNMPEAGKGKKGKSSQAQKNLNDKRSKRRFVQIANTNFGTNDFHISATYNNEHLPMSLEEAEKNVHNYLDRIKRKMKRETGEDLKYMLVTEYTPEEEEGQLTLQGIEADDKTTKAVRTDVSHTKTEEKQNTPQKPQETPTGVSKGDIVTFTGGGVYISSTAEYAAKEKDVVSTCKVTAVNEKGTHKYHCISQDGKGVYGWVNAESIKELSSKAHSDPASVSKGDIVTFTGGGVYKSSTAEYASVQKNVTSTCKVTAVNTKGTHPYHCISQDGKGVYGWVNAADVK